MPVQRKLLLLAPLVGVIILVAVLVLCFIVLIGHTSEEVGYAHCSVIAHLQQHTGHFAWFVRVGNKDSRALMVIVIVISRLLSAT